MQTNTQRMSIEIVYIVPYLNRLTVNILTRFKQIISIVSRRENATCITLLHCLLRPYSIRNPSKVVDYL